MNNMYYTKTPQKVSIIGGGLVGALAALYFAKKGYDVNVYEYREDIRRTELAVGRSINLALSQRGRRALAEVGLEDVILQTAIPMRGRMLHDLKGNTKVVLYDPCNMQCLYSVGRKYLNEVLLNAGSNFPNIKYHFQSKLVDAKLNEGIIKIKTKVDNNEPAIEYTTASDLVLGCDGAYSGVRQRMLKIPGFNFSQEYIEHGYLELCIPALNGQFQMPENYLHIWPRDIFMMIALPNQDRSFTVTLFMPFDVFDSIKNQNDLLVFFKKHFSDALSLIGKERLIHEFFQTKPQHLVSIKSYPFHVGSKAVLLGDAAHAMVPFYGQGMNCGLEDCRILMSTLETHHGNFDIALKQYTNSRWRDAHAICDLAMYNYIEMRDLTKKKGFLLRKSLDTFLYRLFPTKWMPLYNSVSFSEIPYSQCTANRKWQDKILKFFTIGIISALIALFIGVLLFRF